MEEIETWFNGDENILSEEFDPFEVFYYYLPVSNLEMYRIAKTEKEKEEARKEQRELHLIDLYEMFEKARCGFIGDYVWYHDFLTANEEFLYSTPFPNFMDRQMTEIPTLPPIGNVNWIFERLNYT